MAGFVSEDQKAERERFRSFVDAHVVPLAESIDREESMPRDILDRMASEGYWGATVPREFGGNAMDSLTFGLLCEQFGRGSASVLSFLTVHTMVVEALLRCGTAEQRRRWLPALASGRSLGAFALSEPTVGSNARSVQMEAVPVDGGYRLDGTKKWITAGQVADLFLVLAKQQSSGQTAFLVPRDSEGLRTKPIRGMLGFRGAMLAEVQFESCFVPSENVLGPIGSGFTYVVGTALNHGRFCVAWGCSGICLGCVDVSLEYAQQREQFDTPVRNHQLIQEMLANMITESSAARLLCIKAARLRDSGDPDSVLDISIAKYFASRAAFRAACDAVQIHGANGFTSDSAVQRYLRDAKVTEVIEGSNQMQQVLIARYGYHSDR